MYAGRLASANGAGPTDTAKKRQADQHGPSVNNVVVLAPLGSGTDTSTSAVTVVGVPVTATPSDVDHGNGNVSGEEDASDSSVVSPGRFRGNQREVAFILQMERLVKHNNIDRRGVLLTSNYLSTFEDKVRGQSSRIGSSLFEA